MPTVCFCSRCGGEGNTDRTATSMDAETQTEEKYAKCEEFKKELQ